MRFDSLKYLKRSSKRLHNSLAEASRSFPRLPNP